MARMVPDRPGGRNPDKTEREVFEQFRVDAPDSWIVMHHVGLQRHGTKPLAEIDFLVLSDYGVFCIEVKGGLVRREGGHWYAGKRKLPESPFHQVGSAGAALRKEVSELEKLVFGWGCMFPGGKFDETGPEVNPETVYDGTTPDLVGYFKALGEYWEGRYPGRKKPGSKDLGAVAKAVRSDFEMQETLLTTSTSVNRDLARLTNQQQDVVKRAREIDHLVLRGGAGTGKTWLGAIEAVRLADEGKRCLLTCFNRALAGHLQARLVHENLTVVHFDGLVSDFIADGNTESEIPADASQEDVFSIYRPLAAIMGAEQSGVVDSFDCLIIDEGQDLLTNQRVAVLDAILKGGIKDGYWRVLWDPVQNLFGGGASSNLQALSTLGATFEQMPLDVNCRNTRTIADRVEVLSDVAIDEIAFADGPQPVDHEWDGAKVQAKRLRAVLKSFLAGDLAPRDLMILSPGRFENSIASDSLDGLPAQIEDVSGEPPDDSRASIGFATIQSYKGLEADAVVLADIEDIESPAGRALLYVGATRARAFLAVLRRDTTTATFADRLATQALAQAGHKSTKPPSIDLS